MVNGGAWGPYVLNRNAATWNGRWGSIPPVVSPVESIFPLMLEHMRLVK